MFTNIVTVTLSSLSAVSLGTRSVFIAGFTVGLVTGMHAFFQGLQVDDELLQFGSVTTENFSSLQDIAAVVQHSKGVG